jgi:hypothetical protein
MYTTKIQNEHNIFYAIVSLPWSSGEMALNTSIAAWGILVPEKLQNRLRIFSIISVNHWK